MAISSGCVWEVRTAGNTQNGGGYVSGGGGTDFSQQNAAQFALTGVTSSGAGNTVAHASAATSMIGNIGYVVSGTNFTTANPFFEVVSVVVGVSITFGTNSAAASICTGVGASGVINIGGAWKFANSGAADNTWTTAVRAGHTIHIKSGAHAALGYSVTAGSVNLPVKFLGYNSARGDDPTGANRPTIDMTADNITHGAYTTMKNIVVTSAHTSRSVLAGAENVYANCKFINTATTASGSAAIASSGETLLYNSELISRGIGFSASARITLDNCYIHDCDYGVQLNTGSFSLNMSNTIIAGCSTRAVDLQTSSILRIYLKNCTLYGHEDKIGVAINTVTGLGSLSIVNCIFYGFATGVNSIDSVQNFFGDFNDWFNNTTDVSGWTKAATDLALNPTFTNIAQVKGTAGTTAASVLTDAAANFANVVNNQDYCYLVSGTGITAGQYLITAHTATTITLSPAPGNNATADKVYKVRTGQNFAIGTNLKSVGQGGMPGALTTGYMDIGAVQRQEVGNPPTAGDIRSGITINGVVGTAAIPVAADVRSGTAVDATTGSLAVPAAASVLSGVAVDATTGTYVAVATGNAKIGVTFGAASALTGTYDGTDRHTSPAVGDVRSGTVWKDNSTSNNRTGTAAIPVANDVRSGTAVDATTGSLIVADPADVRAGISTDHTVGTLVPTGETTSVFVG